MNRLETFKRELLAHYVEMARQEGWKAQAWFSVNDLARKFPAEFGDLPLLLTQAMNPAKETA